MAITIFDQSESPANNLTLLRNYIIDEIASEAFPIAEKLIDIQQCIGPTIRNQAGAPSILSILNGMDESITLQEGCSRTGAYALLSGETQRPSHTNFEFTRCAIQA